MLLLGGLYCNGILGGRGINRRCNGERERGHDNRQKDAMSHDAPPLSCQTNTAPARYVRRWLQKPVMSIQRASAAFHATAIAEIDHAAAGRAIIVAAVERAADVTRRLHHPYLTFHFLCRRRVGLVIGRKSG